MLPSCLTCHLTCAPAARQVYAGLFPLGGEGQEFEGMCAAMDKLLLNDAR
jgi:hypothetical protein